MNPFMPERKNWTIWPISRPFWKWWLVNKWHLGLWPFHDTNRGKETNLEFKCNQKISIEVWLKIKNLTLHVCWIAINCMSPLLKGTQVETQSHPLLKGA